MTPHLSLFERAILASFILNPMTANEKGRQAVQIVRCAPYAFHRIKPGNDRLFLTLLVSASCRILVRRGYLEKTGTVRRQFTLPYPQQCADSPTKMYDSPIYRLSESGFLQSLNFCDVAHLPPLRTPPIKKKRKAQTPFEVLYGNDSYHVSIAFLASLSSTPKIYRNRLHST